MLQEFNMPRRPPGDQTDTMRRDYYDYVSEGVGLGGGSSCVTLRVTLLSELTPHDSQVGRETAFSCA